MSLSSTSAVTMQRVIRKQKAVKEFQALKRAVTKIQARVRGQQLLEAAESGDISEVKNLLARGADVNATDKYGITALHWAAERGYEEIVKALVKAGADVNAKESAGWTALHYAGLCGFADIVQALVIAGADVNATDNDGWTALQLAKSSDHKLSFKNAIEEGKQKLISLYEHSLHPEVTQERLNDLLSKRITQDLNETPYSKKIFDYANLKRLSKKQIDQVNKYIEERASVTIQKERASVTIQTAYRGYLERKGIKSLNQKSK
tara:strand:- start:27 stop:815 length:789 start_codon:yes stop_codon:yes gene_type:complete